MRFRRPRSFALPRPVLHLATTFVAAVWCLSAAYADDTDRWSNRLETNLTIDGEHWGLGSRAYLNHDAHQLITRYRFDDRYSTQFRWVTQNRGEAIEYRFRLQRKDLKRGIFFWHTRAELRLRESTTDTIRMRPQTGLKFSVSDRIQAYYTLEPHLDFDLAKHTGSFKFVRHLIGFNYRPSPDVAYGPFLKLETDDGWSPNLAYLGFQFHLTLKHE